MTCSPPAAPRRLRGVAVDGFFDRVRAGIEAGPGPAAADALDEVEPARPAAPPEFPLEAFPLLVRAFVEAVAVAVGCPVDLSAVAALVVAGAAIGAARCLRLKEGWTELPALFAVLVAAPGRAKSPALRTVMAPIYEEQERLYADFNEAARRYRAELGRYKAGRRRPRDDDAADGPDGPPEEPPPMHHLFVADTTVEALAAHLERNPKGVLLFRDEVSAWIDGMDMYRRGNDKQAFTMMWAGVPIKSDRKGQPATIVVANPFVAVLGGIQPELLGKLEAEGRREDGFIHRILFCYPAEQPFPGWTDAAIDEERQADWALLVSRLRSLRPARPEGGSDRPRILDLDEGGRRAFAAFVDELAAEVNAGELPERTVGVLAKLKAYAARFALIVRLMRWAADPEGEAGEGPVSAEDVALAVRLVRYFRAHAEAVHRRLGRPEEDDGLDRFAAWLRRRRPEQCTPRDITRAGLPGVDSTATAERLLKLAAEAGLGEWTDPSGRKRGSGKFRPHPDHAPKREEPDKPDNRGTHDVKETNQ